MKLLALHNVYTREDTDTLCPVEGPFGTAIYAVPNPADDAAKDVLLKAMWQYIENQNYEGVILEWNGPATLIGNFILICEPVSAEHWEKIISFHGEDVLADLREGAHHA